MRPLRLELEGFASFRQRTEIDFEGIDLFVLSGPMGAGKSNIIDAIGFALYGSIARYDNDNLIAPSISQGQNQSRVRLDFRLGDIDYTAVRVVRRSERGTVHTEGRLQRGDEVIKENVNEMTEEVTRLLGLTFQQFTKCVVLPQGEFADLLHARPTERQDLLVRLLDLTLYRNVGVRARERSSRADYMTKTLQGRLETDLSNATEEAYRAAEQRLKRLEALAKELSADDEALKVLRDHAAEVRQVARVAGERAALLTAIAAPHDISDLDARLRQAAATRAEAREALEKATSGLEAAQAQRSRLPERAAVEAIIAGYEQIGLRRQAVATAEKQLENAVRALEVAQQKLDAAQLAEKEAVAAHDRLLQADAAYHASQGLKAGDVCPVCGEPLKEAPKVVAPKGIAQAQKAVDDARRTLRAVSQAAEIAQHDHVRREQAAASEREQLAGLEARLEGQPSLEDCHTLRQGIEAAEAELAGAEKSRRLAQAALTEAETAVTDIEDEGRRAWSRFNQARDSVIKAGAAPPAPVESLEAAWNALLLCAGECAAEAEAAAAGARATEEAAIENEQTILQEQAEKCAAEGVFSNGHSPRDAVNAAKGSASQELVQIDDKLAERKSVEAQLADSVKTKRVAGTLEQHLQRNRFERWYLQETMARLVRGASQRLWELSREQYTLDLNAAATDFVVVDHINANEQRPVRTLSGGETFLASLALALALGDEIAGLAANGSARLDALFLDEGFGTLDPDTLETVASTIEDLGARGRMIGIVTHVQELAERIPVQFRVHKDRASSRVERVSSR